MSSLFRKKEVLNVGHAPQSSWSSRNDVDHPCVLVANLLQELLDILLLNNADMEDASGVLSFSQEMLQRVRTSVQYQLFLCHVDELSRVNTSDINAKRSYQLSFFLNLHNLLVLHTAVHLSNRVDLRKESSSIFPPFFFFKKCYYEIPELGRLNAVKIEQRFLRGSSPSSSVWISLFLTSKLKASDERKKYVCMPEPRINFALFYGCPSGCHLQVYPMERDELIQALDTTARAYLHSSVAADLSDRKTPVIMLPKYLEWYHADFLGTSYDKKVKGTFAYPRSRKTSIDGMHQTYYEPAADSKTYSPADYVLLQQTMQLCVLDYLRQSGFLPRKLQKQLNRIFASDTDVNRMLIKFSKFDWEGMLCLDVVNKTPSTKKEAVMRDRKRMASSGTLPLPILPKVDAAAIKRKATRRLQMRAVILIFAFFLIDLAVGQRYGLGSTTRLVWISAVVAGGIAWLGIGRANDLAEVPTPRLSQSGVTAKAPVGKEQKQRRKSTEEGEESEDEVRVGPDLEVFDLTRDLAADDRSKYSESRLFKPNIRQKLVNDMFEGEVFMYVRGPPDTPDECLQVFSDHPKYQFIVNVSGRFKKPISGGLMMGIETPSKLSQISYMKRVLLKVIRGIVKKVSKESHFSLAESEADNEVPHLCFPIVQMMDISIETSPGEKPPPLESIHECKANMDRKNAKAHTPFNDTSTYSFSFFSKELAVWRWKIVNLPGGLSDIQFPKIFEAQPVRLVAYEAPLQTNAKGEKELDPKAHHRQDEIKYVFNFHLMHTSLEWVDPSDSS